LDPLKEGKMPEQVESYNKKFVDCIENIKRRHDPVATTLGIYILFIYLVCFTRLILKITFNYSQRNNRTKTTLEKDKLAAPTFTQRRTHIFRYIPSSNIHNKLIIFFKATSKFSTKATAARIANLALTASTPPRIPANKP
jgi:hypothetical protein